MRVKHAVLAVVLALVVQYATKAQAEELDLDFTLINSTGWSIKEVYIGPSSQDEWGENILKKPLKDGEKLDIEFHPKATAVKWDLKIVWVDEGKPVQWLGLKLTNISSLQLFYDEKTDKTTAKSEPKK